MDERQLIDFLWNLVTRIPIFLITIAGIIWACVQWSKAPKAAPLTLLACIGLLLASCIFPAMFSWLTPALARDAPPEQRVNTMIWTNRAIVSVWNVCTAFCLGALLFAVFAGRAAAVRRFQDYDDRLPPAAPPPVGPDERIQA